jgi:enoyl-[acyl-carrier-protein] reductase (NADH)
MLLAEKLAVVYAARTATLADAGSMTGFIASDLAATMTGSAVNISRGAIVD